MYQSSANFSGWFQLKGKLQKMLHVIVSTRSVFLKFWFFGEGGGSCFLAAPLPPLGVPLEGYNYLQVVEVYLICQIGKLNIWHKQIYVYLTSPGLKC